MTIVLRHSTPPPSVNRAWRMFRGHMVKSKEFKDWDKAAVQSFQASLRKTDERLPTLCYWSTKIFVPVIANRPDIDNVVKAVHDTIRREKIAPDDYYLVKTSLEYWPGDYLIIHLSEEPLEKWQAILKTTTDTARKMKKAKLSQLSPRLV